MKRLDITGNTFGKLTAIKLSKIVKHNTFWLCKCDCGKEKEIRLKSLRNGETQSCGCNQKMIASSIGKNNQLPRNDSGLNKLIRTYKHSAKQRNYIFNLNREDFKKLTSMDCYYCGIEPKQESVNYHKLGIYYYNGLDRIDPNLGYSIENCLPCCQRCNIGKWKNNKKEFEEWIKTVYFNLGLDYV